MILKSLAFILIGFVVGIITGEAQTPAPGAKGETKNFSFFFEGDGSYLGVQTEEITKDNFAKYGLREVRGVAVEKVIEGSPAEKAGIQNGDVIVRFNNDEVTSVRKFTRLLGEVAADHQAKITVIRGGGERELTATLGKRPTHKFYDGGAFTWSTPPVPNFQPAPDFPPMPKWEGTPRAEALPPGAPDQPFVWQMRSGRRIGVGVTTLTKQLSEHFGVTSGVMINDVHGDSPAAKAGLKAGDIIVEAEGKEVKSDGDLIRAIGEKKEGDLTLTIVRQGNRQTVRVTPEKGDGEFNIHFESPVTPGTPMAPQQFKFAMPATPLPPMTEFRFPGRVL